MGGKKKNVLSPLSGFLRTHLKQLPKIYIKINYVKNNPMQIPKVYQKTWQCIFKMHHAHDS